MLIDSFLRNPPHVTLIHVSIEAVLIHFSRTLERVSFLTLHIDYFLSHNKFRCMLPICTYVHKLILSRLCWNIIYLNFLNLHHISIVNVIILSIQLYLKIRNSSITKRFSLWFKIKFPFLIDYFFSSSPYSFLFLPNVYPTSEKSNIITSIGWTSRREKSLINYLNNLAKNAP